MNRTLMARSIAVLLLGVLLGYYIDTDERKTRQMDRAEYLEREGRKFDESKSSPTPTAAMIVGSVIVIGGCVFLYETIVIGILVALKAKKVDSGNSPGNTTIPFS